ncbi:cobyrinate a,c-diamide synthase [Pseudonocardia sp. Cha107L01]|uniref:cobyrinate a,c-diamide synthase n=1 Tax=Pseudonocardia sp. Cha107L01 TaxID=3457576 RepID=UPI00403E638B
MSRAIVIAGVASGTGKTTVATGLMAALRRRGTSVAPFKVGPDYIDPGYHALATGRPGRNLDPVLVGEHRVPGLFRHGAGGAEIAVVEGVMGLFDGRIGPSADRYPGQPADHVADGSTAHVARLLGAPVLLVVDTRGQSRSLAALLHGFVTYRPGTRLAGVVLNQVGSPRHEQVLRDACAEVGLPVLGALPRRDELAVPSRHLGLVTAAEHGAAATAAVDAMAELVARHVDLDAVLAAATPVLADVPPWEAAAEVAPSPGAESSGALSSGAESSGAESSGAESSRVEPSGRPAAKPGGIRPVVAIAGGSAFSFGYAEHAELLAAAGAEVVVFDPLRARRLPAGTAGLVLPGGFPEEHGPGLAANAELRAEVAALARAGAPVHAECGGLLYLATELDGQPMCGVLAGVGRMTRQLRLGYRDAVAMTVSPLFEAGQRVTGHEFHRTTVTPAAGSAGDGGAPAWQWSVQGAPAGPEGYVRGGIHASYLHTHPAGQPGAVARFVAGCARFAAVGTPAGGPPRAGSPVGAPGR